jgi:hypothetical protein
MADPNSNRPSEAEDFDPEAVDLENFETDHLAETAEAEPFDFNQLHNLGNQAIAQGLIIGHGYHQGKYELLHRGEALLLSPSEALSYLQSLMASAETEL